MTRAIFLDRDGTLIEDQKYQFQPDGLHLLGGVASGLRWLRAAGYRLIVITNQSGVARGLFGEDSVREINARLADILAEEQIDIDAFYYCPHHVEGCVPEYSVECECRKPRPGMILQAAKDLRLDLADSWVVGDIRDDVKAGQSAGCRTVLIGADGQPSEPEDCCTPTYTTHDFSEAARLILNHRQGEADG
jgi:D,D-heptose 1,7-bisphosphate phosphatase